MKRGNPVRKLVFFGVIGALTSMPILANAQAFGMNDDEPGFYIGPGVTYSRIQSGSFPNQTDDLEDSRVGYKLIIGIQPQPILALESQYIDFGASADGDVKVNADGWTFGGVLTVPYIPVITPYAKAGALYWDADGKSTSDGTRIRGSDSGTDFTWGAGIGWRVADNATIRTEYERFEMNDISVDLASANLIFNF